MFVEDLIGNTPLVEVRHINTNPNVKIYCKLEGQNPGGSVKDRAAYGMINGALERGDIKKGDKLVEATSGNTGIALAMISRLLGLEMNLIMPDSATAERVKSMEAYGAKVILTPAEKTIEYSRKVAEEMAESNEYFMLNQFANPDNYKAHYTTTGPEIYKDTNGEITHFVSAMGTTGTTTPMWAEVSCSRQCRVIKSSSTRKIITTAGAMATTTAEETTQATATADIPAEVKPIL